VEYEKGRKPEDEVFSWRSGDLDVVRLSAAQGAIRPRRMETESAGRRMMGRVKPWNPPAGG